MSLSTKRQLLTYFPFVQSRADGAIIKLKNASLSTVQKFFINVSV